MAEMCGQLARDGAGRLLVALSFGRLWEKSGHVDALVACIDGKGWSKEGLGRSLFLVGFGAKAWCSDGLVLHRWQRMGQGGWRLMLTCRRC